MSGTQRWGQGQRIIEVLETLGSRWSAGPGSGVDQCPPLFYLGPSVLGRMNSLGLIINYSTKSSQGTEFISLWQPAVGAQCKRACGKWTMVREGPAEQGQPSGARGKMWSACLGKREWWNDHWRSWCPSAPFSRSAFCTLRSPISLWSGSLHAVSSQNSISLREEEIYMMHKMVMVPGKKVDLRSRKTWARVGSGAPADKEAEGLYLPVTHSSIDKAVEACWHHSHCG